MNNISITTVKSLKYAVWGCLYLILLVPLLLSSKFLFPFITLKAIYFRVAIEAVAFLYLLLALADSYYRPKMNKLIWAVLGFGTIVLITTLASVNTYKSFWGNIERGEGFLTISHLIIFFFILSQMIKNRRELFNYLAGSVFVSLLVAVYAMSQRLGASWTIHAGEGRLSSTLGNAAYMGAYALGNIWFCAILAIRRKQLLWKIIFILIGLFEVYILFQTQTRGAMLGFLITLFLLGSTLLFISKNKKIKLSLIIILVLFISLAGLIRLNKDQPWIQSSTSLNRLANISFSGITVESRLYAWDSSWKGWQDRFLIGYGWENYNVAFDRYYHPEIFHDQGSQIWFDRAHNTVFDVAVATGIIGLVAYLAIYLISFIILVRKIKQNQKNLYLCLLLMSFLLAHFLQNIFVFDCLSTYIMMFSVFAIIVFLDNENKINTEHKIKSINWFAFLGGFVIISLAIYNFNIKPVQANLAGIKALQYMYQSKILTGIDLFDQAINMNTYQSPELRQKFAENILLNNRFDRGLTEDQIKTNYKQAINQIKINIDKYPTETQNYLYLMALYNAAYKYDQTYLNKVIYYGHQALELSPTRQQIYFELGRAKIILGQVESGIQDFKYAVELNPLTLDSHWNLMTAYIITGRFEEAESHYQNQMLPVMKDENIGSLERLASLYSNTQNHQKLIQIYKKLIKFNPDNIKYWTRLAIIYKQAGEYNQAQSTASRILEITKDPKEIEQINLFLKTLK